MQSIIIFPDRNALNIIMDIVSLELLSVCALCPAQLN